MSNLLRKNRFGRDINDKIKRNYGFTVDNTPMGVVFLDLNEKSLDATARKSYYIKEKLPNEYYYLEDSDLEDGNCIKVNIPDSVIKKGIIERILNKSS